MTAADLCDLLIRDLVRGHGGTAARWRRAIGKPKVYALETHAHCNWEVRPSGTMREVELIERAVDAIRPRFPFVER